MERCWSREASALLSLHPPYPMRAHCGPPIQERQHPRSCLKSRDQTLTKCKALSLGFPAPKLWRNEFLVFVNHPVCGIVFQQHTRTACGLSPCRFIHTTPLQSVIITTSMPMREVGYMG